MPNDIEIDPAEVVQDEVKIDPAEVVQDPGPKNYSLTRADMKLIQAGFGDDPLGFIADEDRRTYCRNITDKMLDPEGTRKRMALAAYFTRYNSGANYEFIFANMDSILEKHFGKATTVEQAWDKFREMYHPATTPAIAPVLNAAADDIGYDWVASKKDAASTMDHLALAGGAGLAKTVLNALKMVLKFAAQPGMEELAARQMALAPEERKVVENADREFSAGVDNLAKPWRKALTEVQEENTRAVLPDENWFTNFNSEWGYNAAKFLAIQAPQQAAQLLMAYTMGPAAFCLAIGGSSAIDKYYDLEDTPGMTEQQKFINAAFTGFINSGSAWITAGVVKGKIPALNKEAIATGARGAIGYFLKAFGVEAGQEAVEQLAENITDIYTGVHGDPGKMDPGAFTKLLFNGVGESALAGGVFGMTAAGPGFKSWHDRMAAAETTRRKAGATVAALEKKGDLSPQEKTQLNVARVVASQNEPGKVLAADMLGRIAIENDSDETIRKSDRFRELREAAVPEVPDETVIAAARSEREREFAKALPHNVQDTYDAALELMEKFPQFKLQVYDSIDSVPEAVRKTMEAQTETPSLVRAWTDDAGVVHLIGDRVRPDQAARVVGHEIIGHHGLRAVFGDQFDTFLDDVYKLHRSEIDAYAERYKADEESDEGRRYLTEEFLADCADATKKPSWWKEFLARCREFLDRVVGRHHFSDLDIEAALSRSARAMRRRAAAQTDMGMRFAADLNGAVRQKFRSGNTSLRQVAAGFRKVDFKPGTVNLDLGGGKFDEATKFLEGKGVKNLVFDPVNRSDSHNRAIFDAVKNGGVDTVTCNNVLNVIQEAAARDNVILQAAKALKPDGTAYFTVYEGDGSGKGRQSQADAWQEHRKTADYLDEIRKHFADVSIKDKVITARKPQTAGKLSAWAMDGTFENPVRFSIAPVYTGSAADYDKPSLNYVGSGEGAQVYGWGLYGSSSEKVARWYAEVDAERKNHPRIFFDGEEFNQDWYKRDDVYMTKEPTEINALNGSASEEPDAEPNKASVINIIRKSLLSSGFDAKNAKNIRFSVAPGNENLLDWDKTVPEKQMAHIREALRKSDLSDLSDLSDGNRTDRTDRTDRQGEIEENTGKDGAGKVRFSMGERPYYQIPFAEGLARVVDPAQKNDRSPVFVSETPEVFRRIGFTALPMTANARHLRLNYYDRNEFEQNFGRMRQGEHAHGLHDVLTHLPQALEHPLAIVVNLAENATPGSVVAITDMNVNGKKVVVPVLIETQSNMGGGRIDSHLVLTVYDEKNWIDKFLTPALEAEKKGVGIFYFDKEKAARYSALSVLKKGSIPTGFVHNIDDEGSPVKGLFKKITETLQFRRWFGDSKVVDEKGEPLVVYHGTDEEFFVFDMDRTRSAMDLHGAFFSPWEDDARGYGRNVGAFYLSIKNPAPAAVAYKALNMFQGQENAGAKARDLLISQGYDGVSNEGEEYIAFFPEQIKSADKNIGTYDPKNPDTRFSMGELDEETARLVTQMQIITGESLTETGEVYAEKFKAIYGVDLDPKEAKIIASMAVEENRKEYFRRYRKEALQFQRESDPAFDFFLNFAGPEGKLNPGKDHLGEEFTGKWISEAYREYSIKKTGYKTRRGEQNYLARRQNAIDNADGTPLDEVAKAYAEYAGIDPGEAADRILESLRHLNFKEIKSAYSKFRQDSFAFDRETARKTQEEFMRQEKFRIENEVTEILSRGEPVTADFLRENRDVYKELYRVLFDGKEAPYNIGKADLEAVNAALTQQAGNAATYAQAYKDARKKAWEAFQTRFAALRDRLMQSKSDAVKLQREALDLAEKILPPEHRGEFARNIVSLLEYPTKPSARYPEGRRMHELQKIFDRMFKRAGEVRRDEALAEIRKMLDSYRVSRQYKGIPVSKLPAVQTQVSEIGRIFRLSPTALDTYRGAQIEAMGNFNEDTPAWNEARDRAVLSYIFGDLAHRDADAAQEAHDYLKKLITTGKNDLKARLEEKLQFLEEGRRQIIDKLTGGVVDTTGKDAGKFREYSLRQRARLESLLQLASGLSVKDFDQSLFGRLVREYNLAQDREMTTMRRMDNDVREAVVQIFGDEYKGVFGFGRFLREATGSVEHSGVFRKIYTAKVKDKVNKDYFLIGKRPAIRAKVNWHLAEAALSDLSGRITYVKSRDKNALREHFKSFGDCGDDFAIFLTDGKLKVYTLNSETGEVSNFEAPLAALPAGCSYMTLNEIGVNFARHQIDDCAAGIRPVTSEFAEPSADAQYQALNDDGKLAAEVDFIADLPDLEITQAEMENLTRDQAMQLILTWEQDHYKDTMRWNGFDDETMRQLYDFVGEKFLAFARWMREYEARHADKLDQMSRKKYGVPLPRIENYHPGRFEGIAGQVVRDDKRSPLGGMSMNPSFLIARRGHLKAPDVNAGAFGVFKAHMQNQTHFIELNDVVGDLRGIFNDLKVKAAINSTLGNALTNEILRRISSLATSSSQDRTAAAKIFGKLYRDFVPAKLALSLPSMLKQGASALNYMEKIPAASFGRYFIRSLSNHADFRAFRKWAWNSDYMQNRFSGGMDPDLVYLANATLDSEHYDPFLSWMMDKAMIPTKLGDAFAAIYGGYTVYAYTRDQALQNGASRVEAEKLARYAWMKATDETQQGSKLTSKNYFMENPGSHRFLTMFMTNPIQTMDLVLQSIDEVRLGRGDTEARERLARQLFVSHLIIPSAMFFITQAWRHLFNLDEWNWEEYGIACLLGSFGGALYMNLISPIAEKILRIAEGKPAVIFSRGGDRAVPVVDAAENAIATFDRLQRKIGKGGDLTPRDLANGVQALGDAMIAGGQFDNRAGTAGALLSAVGLRVGQVLRWFEDPKENRRRRR